MSFHEKQTERKVNMKYLENKIHFIVTLQSIRHFRTKYLSMTFVSSVFKESVGKFHAYYWHKYLCAVVGNTLYRFYNVVFKIVISRDNVFILETFSPH